MHIKTGPKLLCTQRPTKQLPNLKLLGVPRNTEDRKQRNLIVYLCLTAAIEIRGAGLFLMENAEEQKRIEADHFKK